MMPQRNVPAGLRWLAVLAGLAVCVLLGACATPQASAVHQARPADLPQRVELTQVPFFPQEKYQCGPAALASVLLASGVVATPDSVLTQVFLPGREGSLQSEMLAATRRHGRIAYPMPPRLEAVLRAVARGTPVVVLQNLAFEVLPKWHYAVVAGYDLEREEIVLRSGRTQRLALSLHVFERTWARSGYWAMLALPPDAIPPDAEAERWLGAAVALERGNQAAAGLAYSAALLRWPDQLVAQLGLGNMAYASGNLTAAEAAYRSATAAHPDAADAWNNLSQVVFELGRRDEALGHVERAMMLGGPRSAEYAATRAAMGEGAAVGFHETHGGVPVVPYVGSKPVRTPPP